MVVVSDVAEKFKQDDNKHSHSGSSSESEDSFVLPSGQTQKRTLRSDSEDGSPVRDPIPKTDTKDQDIDKTSISQLRKDVDSILQAIIIIGGSIFIREDY